jgi:hypothetical protein
MNRNAVWKMSCSFCGTLAEADVCNDCQEHFKRYGHHPKEIRRYQMPGQPRVLVRYCGECGEEL